MTDTGMKGRARPEVAGTEQRNAIEQGTPGLHFVELKRAIDEFLTGPMAEALSAVECTPIQPGDVDTTAASAAVAEVQVTHIQGTPDAGYRIRAFDDELQMRIQLNVYRLVIVYVLPLHHAQNCEALQPQFSRWEIGAEHAGWQVGGETRWKWRTRPAEVRKSTATPCFRLTCFVRRTTSSIGSMTLCR